MVTEYRRVCRGPCKDPKPISKFTPMGFVCLDCKQAAADRRNERKNVSITPEEWDMIVKHRKKKKQDALLIRETD